jgi:hypothetical protein
MLPVFAHTLSFPVFSHFAHVLSFALLDQSLYRCVSFCGTTIIILFSFLMDIRRF